MSPGWDLRSLLWEPFPNHRDLDATFVQRRQQLHQQHAVGPMLIRENQMFRLEQHPHLQQQRRRQIEIPVQGVSVQHVSGQQRGQILAAAVGSLPSLVARQPLMANHRGRADAVGLLGEFLSHQHVRDRAALFDLLGSLEPVPGGVDSAVVEANTTTLLHEVSAAERSGGALQTQCSVCLEQFKQGEELRMLPCMHRYHRGCIDRWLAQSAACPVCKHEITR